jgi:hypothetical protein
MNDQDQLKSVLSDLLQTQRELVEETRKIRESHDYTRQFLDDTIRLQKRIVRVFVPVMLGALLLVAIVVGVFLFALAPVIRNAIQQRPRGHQWKTLEQIRADPAWIVDLPRRSCP